jgi:L,D-peptidoglycan transpeptidase YkuD (ErfK/YbiS/YcfS/YnhG family)
MNDRSSAGTKLDPYAPSTRRHTRRCLWAALCALALIIALGWTAGSPATSAALAETAAISADASSSTESSPTSSAVTPARMSYVGNARQLIVVTGAKLGSRNGTLRFFQLESGSWVCTMTVPARFGKRGLVDGARRRAGTKTTPTGLWKMPGFAFGYAKRAPSGSKMRYRKITRRSWWSYKRGRTYNQWKSARKWPGERLYRVRPQYEYAVSTGYNAKPNRVKYGRGTAIFLHVRGRGYTAGCVAISRKDMIKVCRLLDPVKRPACAVGTLKPGSRTSIWAY